MKDFLIVLCIIVTLILLVVNIIATGFGVIDSIDSRCNTETRRIHYVAPGYKLGCWLGEEV